MIDCEFVNLTFIYKFLQYFIHLIKQFGIALLYSDCIFICEKFA